MLPLVIDHSYELHSELAEAVPYVEQAGVPSVMTGFVPASCARPVLVDGQPFVSVNVSVTSTGPLPSGVKKMWSLRSASRCALVTDHVRTPAGNCDVTALPWLPGQAGD